MVRFSGERIAAMMNMLRLPEDTPLEYKQVSRSIQSAQSQVEGQNFEIRKDVLKYDEVLNKQRTVIYDERRKVLNGEDLSDQIRPMIDDVVSGYIDAATSDGYAEEWDLDQLWTALRTLYPISLTEEEAIETAGGAKRDITRAFLTEEIRADAQAAYDQREDELTPEVLRELERRVLLSVVDRKWREHLYEMDYLREGIGLRAMGQRDPLVEYQREGFDMFSAMMEAIKEESVGFVFNLEVEVDEDGSEEAQPAVVGASAPAALSSDDTGPGTDASLAALVERIAAGGDPSDHAEKPHVQAKGLDRTRSSSPLTYSAPELGSDAPEVTQGDEGSTESAKPAGQPRPAARANPNRGSRGNRSSARKRRR